MIKKLLPLINPYKWIQAFRYARTQDSYDKAAMDLELILYTKLLNSGMLHYGYFDDPDILPERISFEQFEKAQIRYAEQLTDHLKTIQGRILDAGCGIGGLSKMIFQFNNALDCLTPNSTHIKYIEENQPYLKTIESRFEDFDSDTEYGAVVHSESLQYIPLDKAFSKAEILLEKQGKWVISDYFRIGDENFASKPHHLDEFLECIENGPWKISYSRDITPHILPTLKYIDMYVKRIALPLKEYAYKKLKVKRPKLFFLSENLRNSIDDKIEREIRTVSPEVFDKDRKYMIFVLEKG